MSKDAEMNRRMVYFLGVSGFYPCMIKFMVMLPSVLFWRGGLCWFLVFCVLRCLFFVWDAVCVVVWSCGVCFSLFFLVC